MKLEASKIDEENLVIRLVTENDVVVATAQLVYIATQTRDAFLLEEVFVPPEYRGNGYSKTLCEMVIKWVEETTTVDRIEGTVNESMTKVFDGFLEAGMRDRHQKSFFWVRNWEERE